MRDLSSTHYFNNDTISTLSTNHHRACSLFYPLEFKAKVCTKLWTETLSTFWVFFLIITLCVVTVKDIDWKPWRVFLIFLASNIHLCSALLMFHSNAASCSFLSIFCCWLVGCLQGIYADITVNGFIKGLYDSPAKH